MPTRWRMTYNKKKKKKKKTYNISPGELKLAKK